jgi:hypothetical protein
MNEMFYYIKYVVLFILLFGAISSIFQGLISKDGMWIIALSAAMISAIYVLIEYFNENSKHE